ncbi:MAG: response regulator [Ruminococcaceae bacterium]|nr:response regulator [Oscillospiraceae bacterium]
MSNKILIADDATFMRMILRDILNEGGFYNIEEAKTGYETVDMYKLLKPAVILLDITMPDMDGIEALKQIKEIDPDAKVIMCSSIGQEAMVHECFEEGADDFVMKPFKPERIIHSVSQYIKKDTDT